MPDSPDTTRLDSAHAAAPAPTAPSATRALTLGDVAAAVRDPQRLGAVRATGLLDTMAAPAFDRLTRLAARLLEVPVTLFSLVEETRDFYVSACGMGDAVGGARELSGTTFCHYAIQAPVPLVIPDTRADPRYRDVETVNTIGVAAYLGVPVLVGGQAIGSFCAIDMVSRQWTDAQIDTLTELAALVEREISLRASVVTAQRLAEQLGLQSAALELERRRVADVFAQAPSFFAVFRGPDNVHELVNTAYEGIIGHGRNVIGKPLFEALPESNGQGFDLMLAKVRTTGEPLIFRDLRVMLERTPGAQLEERFLDVTYFPLVEADGTHDAVIAHGTDVTEQVHTRRALKAAEATALDNAAQLRAFADAMPTLAWTARADGHVDWFNAQWYAYTGTAPEDVEGWAWHSVHDPAVLPGVVERWTASLHSGDDFEMTFPLRAADGTFHMFLTRAVAVRDAAGTVVRWVGTSTNVESEQRLRRAAEEANRAKSEFLAVMSHELRTPLNAIDGYAELMELGIRGPITAEQRHDLARIRKSEKHLLGLINGVLNYAQVEAGATHYDIESVVLEEVLATCDALTAPQMRGKELTLCRQPARPELTVRADREKLQQVILNVLSNAIKFTNRGGKISLGCEVHRDHAGDVVHVIVADTGIGIPDTDLARIFEPFVQVDSQLTRTREGTGLGLAISRDLARAMGGDLTVASTVGVGSTFTLMLRAE